METQSEIRTIKAQERLISKYNNHKIEATFATAKGTLNLLNDETIDSGKFISKKVSVGDVVMVIPLVGAVQCSSEQSFSKVITPGESFTFYNPLGGTFDIKNPYDENVINYLYISLSCIAPPEMFGSQNYFISKADITLCNQFHKLFEFFTNGQSLQIAVAKEKCSIQYKVKNILNDLMIFVVNGTFVFNDTLIEERDGLILTNVNESEFTALTENAVMLLIETPLLDIAPKYQAHQN